MKYNIISAVYSSTTTSELRRLNTFSAVMKHATSYIAAILQLFILRIDFLVHELIHRVSFSSGQLFRLL